MKPIYLVCLVSFVTTISGLSQSGGPDISFGDDGLVLYKTSYEDHLNELIILPDGKILVSGTQRHDAGPPWETGELAMFNPDGTIYKAFGDSGIVRLDIPGNNSLNLYSLLIDEDGKFMVAGSMDYAACVFRINPDGSTDSTFGSNGVLICTTPGYGAGSGNTSVIALQTDGKILVGTTLWATSSDSTAVFRYHPDGTLDTSFGKNGLSLFYFGSFDPLNVNDLAVQGDGKIVVTGSYLESSWKSVVYRLLPDGKVDEDFADNGLFVNPPAAGTGEMSEVVIQPDGKILVAGSGAYRMLLIRLTEHGEPDPAFGASGIAFGNCEYGLDLELLDDGSILVAGTVSDGFDLRDMAVAKFHSNGMVDSTFGDGTGKFSYPPGPDKDEAWALDLQEDGKIVVAGTVEFPDPNNTNYLRTQSYLFRYDYTGNNGNGPVVGQSFAPQNNKSLFSISPNPIDLEARIVLYLEHSDELSLILYDMMGRQVDILTKSRWYKAGEHQIRYYPPDFLEGGVYFLSMEGNQGKSVKMIRLYR